VPSIELEIRNPSGLHARPAATLVRAAAGSMSTIRVANLSRDGAEADARSILGVLGLGVGQGDRIRVTADGEDADEAIARLAALIEDGLGEPIPE
jgi:phosphotransferase system HPr (HPr) family protein